MPALSALTVLSILSVFSCIGLCCLVLSCIALYLLVLLAYIVLYQICQRFKSWSIVGKDLKTLTLVGIWNVGLYCDLQKRANYNDKYRDKDNDKDKYI